MKKLLILLLFFNFSCLYEKGVSVNPSANTSNAQAADNKGVQISWTAYKFPNFTTRAGVHGTFTDCNIVFNNKNTDNPIDILNEGEITINTSSVLVATGEMATKNVGMFFQYFTPTINGKVVNYNNIAIEMNGYTDLIPFAIDIKKDTVILSGTIKDMDFFRWGKAKAKLDSVCGGFHQGKLWADVSLIAKIKI
jgi:hypothetical protein